jgi:hypothetical protein
MGDVAQRGVLFGAKLAVGDEGAERSGGGESAWELSARDLQVSIRSIPCRLQVNCSLGKSIGPRTNRTFKD